MNPSDPLLQVRGLRAGYGSKTILDNVDLTVHKEEIRIILGGSGCGKSTLLRNVTGLELPWAGSVDLLGRNIFPRKEGPENNPLEKVGILFQGGALLSALSVAENVALPLKIHQPNLSQGLLRELVRYKLHQVRLEGAENKRPEELSGGMRKRVGLARALVSDPEFLFCDEPSAGLDPVTSRGLDELLQELRAELGITMFIVTHELDSIKTLADRITFLSEGKVLFDGTLAEAEQAGPVEVRDFLGRKSLDPLRNRPSLAFHLED